MAAENVVMMAYILKIVLAESLTLGNVTLMNYSLKSVIVIFCVIRNAIMMTYIWGSANVMDYISVMEMTYIWRSAVGMVCVLTSYSDYLHPPKKCYSDVVNPKALPQCCSVVGYSLWNYFL